MATNRKKVSAKIIMSLGFCHLEQSSFNFVFSVSKAHLLKARPTTTFFFHLGNFSRQTKNTHSHIGSSRYFTHLLKPKPKGCSTIVRTGVGVLQDFL
jgi:hypothetical protein